ncbi:hypothetical protein [Paenibacillus sp. 1011MAR3C5]|nr:hypothetical protein [Paenibacillus sp. 1011MAR3C5]
MHLVADIFELEQDIGKIAFTPFALGVQKTIVEVMKRFDTFKNSV